MKDEGNNGNGNGNGGDVSEEKTIEVNGTGEMEVKVTAEAENESFETSNYQVDENCTVTWDFKATIKIDSKLESEVKDLVCESVEEVTI